MTQLNIPFSKNISMIPTLDIYAFHYPCEFVDVFDGVITILKRNGIMTIWKESVFFNRNGMKTFIPNSYIELIDILKQGCLESIRSAPVTLIMPCNINELNFDGFHLTISISNNTFHDEPSILTIRIMSSVNDVTVWEKLSDIMSEISNLLSYRFHFSTLGFGFFSTMNINSFQEMKFSSFRYLGGVLFDPLCTNSMDLIYGLRSISWKILISSHSLLEWGAKDILDSTEHSGDNVFFRQEKWLLYVIGILWSVG